MKIPKLIFATLLGAAGAVVPAARDAQASTVKIGNIDSLTGGDTVSGWACQLGSPASVSIKLYAGSPVNGGVLLASGTTSLASEPAIGVACSSTSNALRFQLTIPPALRAQYAESPLVVLADDDTTLGGSGDFVIPPMNGGAWSFDDVSGSTAKGTYDNGTLVNGPQWTAAAECHSGTCLSFPNNKSKLAYVDVPYSNALKFGTGDFTIAAWIKMAASVVDQNCIISTRPPAVDQGMVLTTSAGKAQFFAYGVSGGFTPITSQTVVADGGWHYVVVRRVGTQISLDVDAKLQGTSTVPATYNSNSTVSTLRIGAKLNTSEAFVGSIDDVQYLGRALSDDEVGAASAQRNIHIAAPVVLGNVDSLTGGDTVSGWACQQRSPASLPVQVYAGDPANGGVLLASGTTSLASEPAIGAACPSTSSTLRYQVTVPANLKATYQDYPLHVTANGTALWQSGVFRLPMTKGSLWPLNEGSGSVTQGTLANGTLVNGPQWAAASECVLGACLSFPNNKTQKASVDIPYTSALKFGTGDFTISTWVKTTNGGGQNLIVGTNPCGVQAGWSVAMVDGKAALGSWGNNGGWKGYRFSEVSINDGAWHQLVGRRKGSTFSLIVDGGLAATDTVSPTWNSDSGASIVRIGKHNGCDGNEFVGSIDEVQLVGRALTDAELGVEKPKNWSTINLRSLQNNKLVTADPRSPAPLLAGATAADEWETLQVQYVGSGIVAFRGSNQSFVSVASAGDKLLRPSTPGIPGDAAKFRWIDLGNHKVALRSLATNQYVCADNAGNAPLIANRGGLEPCVMFEWQPAPIPWQVKDRPLSFRTAKVTPFSYLTAVQGAPDTKLTVASTTSPLTKFRILDEGAGRVSIRSLGTDLYLSAWDPAGHGLIPNALTVGPWETFEYIYLGGTSDVLNLPQFALRSVANGMFVSVTGNAGAKVISLTQSAAPGDAETLEWLTHDEGVDQMTGGGFSYLWDKNFGNKDLGVSVFVLGAATNQAGIDATLASVSSKIDPGVTLRKLLPSSSAAAPADFAEVLGTAGISATLFWDDLNIVEMTGYEKNDGIDHFSVTAGGYTVTDTTVTGVPFPITPIDRTFMEAHKEFPVYGIVPVIVRGEITGVIKGTLTPKTAPNALAEIKPEIALNAILSAGIGDDLASAGLQGVLKFLDVTAPLTIGLNPLDRTYTVSETLSLAAMQGSINVYVRFNEGLKPRKYWYPLVTSGPAPFYNKTLFTATGTLQ